MRKPALLFVITLASLLVLPAAADSSVAGNGFFQVIVEDTAGADGLGAFSLRTGPNHPAGGGHDVLFSGASAQDAASSYLTVRSYTTGTDYVQTTRGAASAYLVAPLDALATMEPIGSTGFRTTYVLPGFGDAPDSLRIVSEIEAAGFTTADAAVDLRTSVTNEGSIPVAIGVRYLLDFANGGDDGPAWREAGGPLQIVEGARGINPGVVTLSPTSQGAAPVPISVDTSSPSAAVFASWTHAFPFAFDYTPAGRDVAGPCGINDSALLTYVGENQASAIVLAPGESATVLVSLSIGDTTYFEPDSEESCSTPVPMPTPAPGQPTPVPEPIELPRTGGRPSAR